MSEIPKCANSRPGGSCPASDVIITAESDNHWTFYCRTCHGIQVVSKDGIRNRSKFEALKKRREQEAEMVRRAEKRRKIFA